MPSKRRWSSRPPTLHPKTEKMSGKWCQMSPKCPKMGARARIREPTFSIIFRPRTPLGAQRVPEVRFLTVWGRFRSIPGRFWVDFRDFSSIVDRCGNRPRPPEDLKKGPNIQGIDRSIDRPIDRFIDPSIPRPGHGGGFAEGSWIFLFDFIGFRGRQHGRSPLIICTRAHVLWPWRCGVLRRGRLRAEGWDPETQRYHHRTL